MAIYQCLYNPHHIDKKTQLRNEEALAQLIIFPTGEGQNKTKPPQTLSSYRGNNLYWQFTLCVL